MSARGVPRIHCGHCKGRGRVPMPMHLFRVLLEVRGLGSATAAEARRALYILEDVSPTAMCNRLADLEALGFLVHSIEGRQKRYRLAGGRSPRGTTPPSGER